MQSCLKHLSTQRRLAVDTEFVRTNTYYAKLGLLQIASEQQVFLIDPLAIDSQWLDQLGDLFLSDNIQIVMHSAGEDLEIFLRLWNQLPKQLFDTQIAAGFIGFDRQVGLQRLLKETLGVEISKDVTRSDWLQRPLTNQQKLYAAADVYSLLSLADWVTAKLNEKQRMSWFKEECDALLNRYINKPADSELYLSFNGAWKFNKIQQAQLKRLVQWREETARSLDTPKTFIIKDPVIYSVIERQPTQKRELMSLGLQPGQVRKFGDQILQQLSESEPDTASNQPIAPPLTKPQQKSYKVMRQWLLTRAEELQMPAELLASKAQLSDYLLAREAGNLSSSSPFLNNWRYSALQGYLDAKVIPEIQS